MSTRQRSSLTCVWSIRLNPGFPGLTHPHACPQGAASGVVASTVKATVHSSQQSFQPNRTNLHFTGCHQVTPLLDDVLQADTGQGQPDLTDNVMLGKSIEVVDLHHQCGFRYLCLWYLQGKTQEPGFTAYWQPCPTGWGGGCNTSLSLQHFPIQLQIHLPTWRGLCLGNSAHAMLLMRL